MPTTGLGHRRNRYIGIVGLLDLITGLDYLSGATSGTALKSATFTP